MRVLIGGGGTGGGVYPALAVARALDAASAQEGAQHTLAWIGTAAGLEREIVDRQGIRFLPVSAGAIRGAGPIGILRSAMNLARGTWQARRIVRGFAADVVLVTGGFVSVPLMIAAWLVRCPTVIYLPDMEPGLAVRWLARLATRVAVSFEEAVDGLPAAKTVVTGYPVRPEINDLDREEARARLGLGADLPLLLVMGGSRGARSINIAVGEVLPSILQRAQVLHISGREDYQRAECIAATIPAGLRPRYRVVEYMHEDMMAALVAADLAITRAGAATLGEFPAAELPAILVPYPYAGQHQEANARHLADAGAALIVDDDDLAERLLPSVLALLDDQERLGSMRKAARALRRPLAAEAIAQLLLDMCAYRRRNATRRGQEVELHG